MQGIARRIVSNCGLHSSPDSFYIANMKVLQRKIGMWKEELPDVRAFYAMKCNPDKVVMKTMIASGFGFDAASKNEIAAAIDTGADAEKDIIFAHPVKKIGDIDYAIRCGVRMTTFDNVSEVEKLVGGLGGLLRLRIDNPSARIDLGMKYGVDRGEYKHVIDRAIELGVDVKGVCFHVGSASKDPLIFREALKFSREVIEYGRRRGGYEMGVLDIGGGFTGDGFVDCARVLRKELKDGFKDVERVIAEPGRFFAEDVFTFFTPIIGQKEKAGKKEYWIGDSLYGSFNCILYDQQIPVFNIVRNPLLKGGIDDQRMYPSVIQGVTCDSRDTLETNIILPHLRNGDYLMVENFGAYTVAGACNFNGINMAEPKVFYIGEEF